MFKWAFRDSRAINGGFHGSDPVQGPVACGRRSFAGSRRPEGSGLAALRGHRLGRIASAIAIAVKCARRGLCRRTYRALRPWGAAAEKPELLTRSPFSLSLWQRGSRCSVSPLP